MNYALIIAGGSGNRMGQDIPKQFMHIDDCPIIIHTLLAFQRHPNIDGIAVVCLEGWETVLQSYANQFNVIYQNDFVFENLKKLERLFPSAVCRTRILSIKEC